MALGVRDCRLHVEERGGAFGYITGPKGAPPGHGYCPDCLEMSFLIQTGIGKAIQQLAEMAFRQVALLEHGFLGQGFMLIPRWALLCNPEF